MDFVSVRFGKERLGLEAEFSRLIGVLGAKKTNSHNVFGVPSFF
jgi:hypothetical protein